MALQRGADGGQQIVAADQEFNGLLQLVQRIGQAVLQGPGEGDDGLGADFHGADCRIAGSG